jgi:hypothetical protein
MHSSKGKILMNLNVQDEWYNGRKNKKQGTSWAIVCWTLNKIKSKFSIFIFTFVLFVRCFYMFRMQL